MNRWEIAIFVALIALAVGIVVGGVYRIEKSDPGSRAPCSEYCDTPIRNVPLRCFPNATP